MQQIGYYSTNLQAEPVSFSKALLKGIAPDGGLYMPDHFPSFTQKELAGQKDKTYDQIAFAILNKFLAAEMAEEELLALVKEAYNFEVPLEHIYDKKYVMRLDRGPTASFKDFAARMMARLMSYFLAKENRELLILTATSGDTGSAIANAFYGLDNISVVVLFPEREVTDRQRKQMTTLKKNIYIIALDGKFDDCQALVKKAFADNDLDDLNLSSANSINIGRLLPQAGYYAYAYSKLADFTKNESVIFSVPSGNFGNLMGGLIARNCISSAMNVGHPSNMSRLFALFGGIMDEKGMIHQDPELPLSLEGIEQKEEFFIKMSYDYSEFRDFLKKHF